MTNEQKHEKLLRMATKGENDLTKELNAQYKVAYFETLSEIRKYHALYNEKGNFSVEEMMKYNRLRSLNNTIADLIDELYKENVRVLNDGLSKAYLESYAYTGFIMETETQVKLNYTLIPRDQVIEAIQTPLSGLTLKETLLKNEFLAKNRIRQELTQSVIQGRSIQDTSKRIQRVLDIDYNSAVRIARTENTRLRNAGKERAYQRARDLGIKFAKIWVATLDDRTRDAHRDLDGQKADEEGFFRYKGSKAIAPGQFAEASLNINCRCGTIAREYDIPMSMRRENIGEKKIIPYQTYREWEKNRLDKKR